MTAAFQTNAFQSDAYQQDGGALSSAVSLSGNSATGATGAFSVAVVVALSGNAAVGAVGGLTPSVAGSTAALSGNAATGAIGSFGVAVSAALTGDGATGLPGSVAAAAIAALTGNGASGAVGSFQAFLQVTLSGVVGVGSVGNLSPAGGSVSVDLTGVQSTGGVGDLLPSGGDEIAGGGGGASAPARPGGLLHLHKLAQAFKDKQEREEAIQKLPKATEQERVVLRKSARKLIEREPVNYKELETRVAEDLAQIGLQPEPHHLEWLLFMLRVEAYATEQQALLAEEEAAVVALTLWMMEN